MKKSNSKGFMLLETLIVSSFIITILIFLYIQFVNLKTSYDTSFKYDSIPNLYNIKQADIFINKNYGYGKFKDDLRKSENNNYIEIYKNTCNISYFSNNISYCNKLMSNLNIKTLLIIDNNLSKIKLNFKQNNPYSNGLLKYLNTIDPILANKSYLLIAEFNDNTYSYLKLDEVEPVCRRANTLTSDGTHTFGTNTRSTLVPGMALDCKVTADGDYDHRFYYVTDLESNSDYAVLIYNNNIKVVSGTLSNDNTVAFAYDSSNENWHGPQSTIMDNLPTTTHWNNISLSNTTRAIKAANYLSGHIYADATSGGTTPTAFSYAGKAARLLTYKEVVTACDSNNTVSAPNSTGYLDNCTYLMENTNYSNTSNKYGYWLETPRSSSSDSVWFVIGNSSSRRLYNDGANIGSFFGVRPAIEVKKSDIDLK